MRNVLWVFCLAVVACGERGRDGASDADPTGGNGSESALDSASVPFVKEGGPPVRFLLPSGWVQSEPESRMRLAEIAVPGETELQIVVFFFGPGGGGGRDANLDRWKAQLAGGESKSETFEIAGDVSATLLDATGTYVAETMPGSGERLNESDQRLLAVYLDCPGGPLFLKLVGDRKVVDTAEADFRAWVRSFRPFRVQKSLPE
jgi:hypothetical protein